LCITRWTEITQNSRAEHGNIWSDGIATAVVHLAQLYPSNTQINSGSSSFATFRVKLKHVGLARAQSAMLTRIISRSVYRRQGSTLRQTMPAAGGLALALYSVSEQSPIQMKQCSAATNSRFVPHSKQALNFKAILIMVIPPGLIAAISVLKRKNIFCIFHSLFGCVHFTFCTPREYFGFGKKKCRRTEYKAIINYQLFQMF